jgi:hypothetical protein
VIQARVWEHEGWWHWEVYSDERRDLEKSLREREAVGQTLGEHSRGRCGSRSRAVEEAVPLRESARSLLASWESERSSKSEAFVIP